MIDPVQYPLSVQQRRNSPYRQARLVPTANQFRCRGSELLAGSELTSVTEFMLQDFLDGPDLRLRNHALLARTFGLQPTASTSAANPQSIAGISLR